MQYLKNLSEKLLEHKEILSENQIYTQCELIIYQEFIKNIKIIGVNLRSDVIKYIEKREQHFTNVEIAKKSDSNIESDAITITSKDNLDRFKGSLCDLVILDSCLAYCDDPVNFLHSAFNIANTVRCIVVNYANFKRRFHFAINGKYDFFDGKRWDETSIKHPFGIYDFIKMCNREHIVIKNARYVTRKSAIKDALNSGILPNLYLDEVVFTLTKL